MVLKVIKLNAKTLELRVRGKWKDNMIVCFDTIILQSLLYSAV